MASIEPEKEFHNSGADSDHDDSYAIYQTGRDFEANPAEAKRALRKIDYRIIPILFTAYMLDKNSLNLASVYGLQQGTHLVGQDYSWLGKTP